MVCVCECLCVSMHAHTWAAVGRGRVAPTAAKLGGGKKKTGLSMGSLWFNSSQRKTVPYKYTWIFQGWSKWANHSSASTLALQQMASVWQNTLNRILISHMDAEKYGLSYTRLHLVICTCMSDMSVTFLLTNMKKHSVPYIIWTLSDKHNIPSTKFSTTVSIPIWLLTRSLHHQKYGELRGGTCVNLRGNLHKLSQEDGQTPPPLSNFTNSNQQWCS